jgi:hypothetical protein
MPSFQFCIPFIASNPERRQQPKACCAHVVLTGLFVVGLFLGFSSGSSAQNIQKPNATSDFTKRSDLRVDPSTLGLNIQIPLGNYPGRGGNDLSVVLYYSSKV